MSRLAGPPTSRGSPCRHPASPGFPARRNHNRTGGLRVRSRPPQPPLQRRRSAQTPAVSFDGDVSDLGLGLAAIIGPAESDLAAFGGNREEGDERICGYRRVELGAKHLLAIIGAAKAADNVARESSPGGAKAITGLHRVGDQ